MTLKIAKTNINRGFFKTLLIIQTVLSKRLLHIFIVYSMYFTAICYYIKKYKNIFPDPLMQCLRNVITRAERSTNILDNLAIPHRTYAICKKCYPIFPSFIASSSFYSI